MTAHKQRRLLILTGTLFVLFANGIALLPREWDGVINRQKILWLLVIGGLLAYVGLCLAGAIGSAETLKKWSWLIGTENPRIARIACIIGVLLFITLAVGFVAWLLAGQASP
jgi:hypothetical protein